VEVPEHVMHVLLSLEGTLPAGHSVH